MYQRFYGLRELPFELTPNPKFLFLTPRHREALSNLQFGLSTNKALTVLIGEAGTGKTTLLKAALESEACRNLRYVCINNPALTRDEFVEYLANGFDLGPEAAQSKTAMLNQLEKTLIASRAQGETIALIVDEAQRLSDELLEEIRLLANIETAEQRLLPLVLTGQPELAARLNTVGLRQLKQRVALRCEISPFDVSECASYISYRIRTAGGEAAKLFTREAVRLIHERSQGIARTVSVICENALLSGFALGIRPVNRQIVHEVCEDFDLNASNAGQLFTAVPVRDETSGLAASAPGDAGLSAPLAPEPVVGASGPARKRRLLSIFG